MGQEWQHWTTPQGHLIRQEGLSNRNLRGRWAGARGGGRRQLPGSEVSCGGSQIRRICRAWVGAIGGSRAPRRGPETPAGRGRDRYFRRIIVLDSPRRRAPDGGSSSWPLQTEKVWGTSVETLSKGTGCQPARASRRRVWQRGSKGRCRGFCRRRCTVPGNLRSSQVCNPPFLILYIQAFPCLPAAERFTSRPHILTHLFKYGLKWS